MSVCNYADSSISIYSLRVQVSALKKHLALFCLVIHFCTKVMGVTAESLPDERQEALSEVSEIPLPLGEDHPEPERISSKLRMASHLVARAQTATLTCQGRKRKSSVNFPPSCASTPFPPFSLSLPTSLCPNLSSGPKFNTAGAQEAATARPVCQRSSSRSALPTACLL
jgi:hypothetical protein